MDELSILSGQLEFTSEALAAGLNKVSESMGTMSDSIAYIPRVSSDISQIDDRTAQLVTNVNTLQTIVLATLAVAIIAVVLPFVRKT